MAIGVILEWNFRPEVAGEAPATINKVLETTRAFDGCLHVDVLVDDDDPCRILLVETWESIEHDAKYREFRSQPANSSGIQPLLAGPAKMTRYAVVDP